MEVARNRLVPSRSALLALATLVLGHSVASASVTFTGSGVNPVNANNPIAASVEFDFSGSTLTVTLTNTAASDVGVPTDVLTGVFWNMNIGSNTLTRASGLLAGGSTVFYDADGQPAGGVIGGEWAYNAGLSHHSAAFGISSSGLGLFGPGDRFPGADLESPASPDGVQYGLLSAGDNPATGNGGITGSGGLIRNSVVFTLTNMPTNFSLSSISGVLFQYGTDVSEPWIPGVPTPGAAALLGLGGLLVARRRRV